MTMGTAATMMAIAEALGLTLPGASSIPAADANHPRMCGAAGRRIVEMVWEDLTPDKILTPAAFDNAIKVHMAMGGSTNAIIHVVAMARRAGIPLKMERFDELSRQIPVMANVRPSGQIPDGGFLLRRRPARPDGRARRQARPRPAMTVTGKTLRREHRGRQGASARRHPLADNPISSEPARPRAQRQSRAERLRDEAVGRREAAPEAQAARRSCSRTTTTWRADRARRSRRHAPTTCWC